MNRSLIERDLIKPASLISVTIGRWGVAKAPSSLRTLLGSCVGITLHDRTAGIGGLAHVVLPKSRGDVDHPGKYADTAIPALLADLERLAGRPLRGRLTAKLFGGARMFNDLTSKLDIGSRNRESTERILEALGIPIIGRDLGGETGRNIVLSTETGAVSVKIPGGPGYEV